eukprot:SAG11_NODE_13143_length_668_cov_0.887522_1_plen_51_part_10
MADLMHHGVQMTALMNAIMIVTMVMLVRSAHAPRRNPLLITVSRPPSWQPR